ncbi:hypothetical protein JMJ35_002917 [Cladonia borealis]|uniref:Uncharacterized protein n=1 Tax=Cladonia borealis TaxID=184061 RepID=A0AA39R3T3_9LECA|nr:hypothetical protein JMJ35_002917 [Cladonia borealis]
MAPSSLKKMSGSKGRKEGNYASSDRSTSVDVFTSDDLGLTLLPRPQIQKNDVGEKVQAAIGRPTTIHTTEQQGDGQRCPLELEEQCHPMTRRSTVNESIGGSYYFGLSKRVERYLNTGSYNNEAVLRPDDCCSGIQGDHDLKREDLILSTEKIPKDIVNGLHHDRKANTIYSSAPYHSSLAKKERWVERDSLFNSSNQMHKGEVRKIGLNGASDSLEGVLGNEHDGGRDRDAKACENSLRYKFWELKEKKSKTLFLTCASGNIGGLTFTKPITNNRLSKDHPLGLSTDTAQKPYHSTRTSESENTNCDIPETNRQSHSASALLVPVELQSSSKAIPTTHQQALNSLQLSSQLILEPSQASPNLHAAPPKTASILRKHLRRSWTRHFPTRSKDLTSKGQYSDHAHTSSATPSCSIASKIHSNSLKAGFARENRYKIRAHPNSRILASSPPPRTKGSPQASYDLERATFNNVDDTVHVQSRLKAGIKRSKSLPDPRLLHQLLDMNLQQGHQLSRFSQPPREHHVVGAHSQYQAANYTSLPTNHAAQSTLRDTHGDINTPLMKIHSQHMNANISQAGQSLANSGMGVPVQNYNQINNFVNKNGNFQPVFNNAVSTNDGLTKINGDPLCTAAEFMTLQEEYGNLSRRLQNLEKALDCAREQNRICNARCKDLERSNEDLRQQLKSDTAKNGKSRNRGIVDVVEWVRQSYPTGDQQSLNARSPSLENISIPRTSGNDGPSLESGATINTMVSPTQRQDAALPALATAWPLTQARDIQAPCLGLFQPEVQSLPGPYIIPNDAMPTFSHYLTHHPDPQPFGQFPYHETQPGHPFHNIGNQFQHIPGDHFLGYREQSPQFLASRTPPAAVQAEASTSGIKRKSDSEPYADQGAKRQQQHVEIEPGFSLAQAATDEQAQAEAWREMLQKDYEWLDGVNPINQIPKDGKQFGIPSASLIPATTHPAMMTQAPKGLIAPTPGEAPRKTTQKTPTRRKVPKTDLEKKAKRALYNKKYKTKKKEKELLEKNKAAESLEASETALPSSNADSDNGPLPGRPVDPAQEEDDNGNDQSSDLDAEFDEDPETQETHAAASSCSTNHPNLAGPSLDEDQASTGTSFFEDAMMESDGYEPPAEENYDPPAEDSEDSEDSEDKEDKEESEESEESEEE